MEDPASRIRDSLLETSLQKIRELKGSYELSQTLRNEIPGFKSQKGIYKPQNSKYALWIRHTNKGIYPDKDMEYLPDGSWTYRYSPEGKNGTSDLSLGTNQGLFNSMQDRVPLGVFIQKELPGVGATYEVMGLAYVESYDEAHFLIRGEPIDYEEPPMEVSAISPFSPFDPKAPRMTETWKRVRERSFQTVVRSVYNGKCSLCEIGYSFRGQPVGVEAAHIIPVEDNGTSKDVRNGILLCKNHHDLFDRYLWAFDEDYHVMVSDDRQFRKSALNNHLLVAEGKKLLNLPRVEYDFPAREAIYFRLDRFFQFNQR